MRQILSHADTLSAAGNPNRKSLYNWVKKGLFPEPIQIGPNKIGWYEDEVAEWVDDRPRGFIPARPELKEAAERRTKAA